MYRTLFIAMCFLSGAAGVYAQEQQTSTREAEQVLFLIDDSSSMTEPAFAPPDSAASRWELVQKTLPEWLARLNDGIMVGAVSVGGECGAAPFIKLPIGAERGPLLDAIGAARPQGMTNLNAVLQTVPTLFNMNVSGGKRVILLSDGGNTCHPSGSTCEIARSLHRDHGIVIDVAAWVTNPKVAEEFKCVADATGGAMTTPRNMREWENIPLPSFDPWRYVVLALNVLTFVTASTLFYRHAHHALGWATEPATLAAGLLLALSTLAAYVTLFWGSGVLAALLGLVITAAVLLAASRQRRARSDRVAASVPSLSPWAMSGVFLLVLLLPVEAWSANDAAPTGCKKVVQGQPRYHHILAIDVSGSVAGHVEQMKALLSCYGEMYTLPDEELTLIAFGQDEHGTVKELRTFTVPHDGSTEILDSLLEDLEVQNPGKTKTYFRPLADFLNQLLPRVRLEPIIMVVSDGISDGFADAEKKSLQFTEVSFESFGTRGLYSAPGMKDWRVAVQGGHGLDLTTLFQRPVIVAADRQRGRRSDAVVEPCLVNPQLVAETDDELILQPSLNPFETQLRGSLTIHVKNVCAARFRTFKVGLRHGADALPVGEVERALVDGQPRPFTFDVSLPPASAGKQETAIVQLVVDNGGNAQTVYAKQPASLAIKRVSYLSAYGLPLGLGAGALLTLVGSSLVLMRSRRRKEHSRPEVVKTLGGRGVPLARHQPVTVGGEGCVLAATGMPAGVELATVEWTGTRGELFVQPSSGFQMRVDGKEIDGGGNYRLGRPLQFIDRQSGAAYDVTLYAGTSQEISFSPPLGLDVPLTGPSFHDMGGVSFRADGTGFGAPTASNGNGSAADTYI